MAVRRGRGGSASAQKHGRSGPRDKFGGDGKVKKGNGMFKSRGGKSGGGKNAGRKSFEGGGRK
eukprot:130417-Hanusia_phi.AAC.1